MKKYLKKIAYATIQKIYTILSAIRNRLYSMYVYVCANSATELRAAAKHGCVWRVAILLRIVTSINARDQEGRTALQYAASQQHVAIMTMLLDWQRKRAQKYMIEQPKDIHTSEFFQDANIDLWESLVCAATVGHAGISELILDFHKKTIACYRENPKKQDQHYLWQAVVAAMANDHRALATILLMRTESSINCPMIADYRATMLLAAESKEHHEIVAILDAQRLIVVIQEAIDADKWYLYAEMIPHLLKTSDGINTLATILEQDAQIAYYIQIILQQAELSALVKDSALLLASTNNHDRIAYMLLDIGANPLYVDVHGLRPVAAANQCKNVELVHALRDAEQTQLLQQNDTAALLWAVRNGYADTVCALCAGSVDINAAHNGRTALTTTIQSSSISMLLLLLEIPGINVNQSDTHSTPLILAIHYQRSTMIELLLEIPTLQINNSNSHGVTPLMCATHNHDTMTLQQLLQQPSIDINRANTHGMTALMLAVRYHNIPALHLLLARPEIRAQDTNTEGMNALMLAARYHNISALHLLLARPEIRVQDTNTEGMTALMLAQAYAEHFSENDKQAIALLLHHSKIAVGVCEKKCENQAPQMPARCGM